jgi:hypothetical protein
MVSRKLLIKRREIKTMRIRRTNKDSYGWSQSKDFNGGGDIVSKNGKIFDGKSKSIEELEAFNRLKEGHDKALRDRNFKETKSGNIFRVGRHSKNPFKDGILLDVGTNKERDTAGRKMRIVTSSSDSVKAFKEYLKMKDSIWNEKIDNKEIKNEIRKVARKKAIQRGAIIGSAIAGTAGIGYGIKKAIDKKKKKDKE